MRSMDCDAPAMRASAHGPTDGKAIPRIKWAVAIPRCSMSCSNKRMYLRLGQRKFFEENPTQIAAGLRRIRRARWAAFLAFVAVPAVFLVAGLSIEGLATLLSWSLEARDRYSPWLLAPPALA